MRRKKKELFMHTSPIYAPISNAMASAPDSPFSVARVVNYRIKGIFEYKRKKGRENEERSKERKENIM